ncbi:MAG: PQQ-binding-like beta-propeller repeat protein [Gemmatimonadetes bacterium]|nr:PQQ-binding-like beta-propeller repeat protein [Gemmatimonadota bacterium]MBP9199714.1 PQQ-binding-like beta-propeller repeat protein [Gemmatimonadales bacterium]MBK7348899.1 PQQ-binding-like beta-propeller repeat protein [Gemmatimonadota bacterium]MBK7714462.1 PQQ-binding-like beta-propeller repeat protein [Gemmatimonadota bacterium]MBK7783529.1 PQQ-binding-like beta-propeller repeat protein [Gemmatimonadota bacterium]
MVNAGCTGYRPVPEFDPGDLPRPAALVGTPLTRLWRVRPLRGPTAPVGRDGQNLYLGGADRRVVAVDLASGKTRWAHRVAGPMLGGVQVAGDVVYAATSRPEGKVHAFQAVSGSELWSTGTGYVEAPLAILPDRIIVLTRRMQVLALNRSTGKVLWRRRLAAQRIAPQLLANGLVLVTGYDSLYLVRPADGTIQRRRRAPGAVTAPWVPLGSRLLGATGDSLLVALDPDSLTVDWSVRLDAPVLSSPVVRRDTIYAVTLAGSIYRVPPGDVRAAERLRAEPWAVTGAPQLFGEWLLVGGSDGSLRAFALAGAEPAWQTPLGRPLELAPVALGEGDFVAVGGQGDLHRIRLGEP